MSPFLNNLFVTINSSDLFAFHCDNGTFSSCADKFDPSVLVELVVVFVELPVLVVELPVLVVELPVLVVELPVLVVELPVFVVELAVLVELTIVELTDGLELTFGGALDVVVVGFTFMIPLSCLILADCTELNTIKATIKIKNFIFFLSIKRF